jgi:hypothetical protein
MLALSGPIRPGAERSDQAGAAVKVSMAWQEWLCAVGARVESSALWSGLLRLGSDSLLVSWVCARSLVAEISDRASACIDTLWLR